MGHSVLCSILSSIFNQHWFAFLADQTRDISNSEQLLLCIAILWVLYSYENQEDIVGLFQLSDTTAETIYNSLVCTYQFRILVWNLQGQAYDGVSNFKDIFLNWE